MQVCAHCGELAANLAERCPACGRELRVTAEPVQAPVYREPAPDYAGYLVVGVLGLIAGIFVQALGEPVVGVVITAIASGLLLVGLIGHGVYLGMRQFREWSDADAAARAAEESSAS